LTGAESLTDDDDDADIDTVAAMSAATEQDRLRCSQETTVDSVATLSLSLLSPSQVNRFKRLRLCFLMSLL